MALALQERTNVIHEHRRHEKDTGSPEVQIALLTDRIKMLSQHLKQHSHDFGSRRGLLQMVSRRNRLLRYLARTNESSYRALIQSLGLRK